MSLSVNVWHEVCNIDKMGCTNCLKHNTKLEKQLILFVILLCGVTLVLLITMLSSDQDPDICDSAECVRAATHILDTVDPTADPCVDFYQFVCGSFLKNAFSLGRPSALHHLDVLMKNKLKEIVMENDEKRNRPKSLQMQRRFYRACVNETLIEADRDQTFLSLLDEVTGRWPAAKGVAWNESNFDWTTAMVKARKLGFFYQFFIRVKIYSGNDTNMIWIKPPHEKDYDFFHWRAESENVMKELAKYFGAQSVDTSWEIGRTFHFAKELKSYAEKYSNSTKGRRRSTVKDLQHNRIKINWLDFLRGITGVGIKEDDVVLFDVDDYFVDLYHLLLQTPKRVRANYMAWGIISTNVDYLSKEVRQKFKMLKFANETKPEVSRSDLCFEQSRNFFPSVAEGEYVRRFTPLSKREHIRDMIKSIKTELRLVLEQLPWMDEDTRSFATEHLHNITEEIGWTKSVYDVKKFEKYLGYHQLRITSDKLIDIARLMTVHYVNQYYRKLRESSLEEEEAFNNTPRLDVNAFYLKYFEKLILLAPILQELIFDEHRPNYMNYGALGSIIGHEFMHGFIETEERTWWSNATIMNYKNVSSCIVEDYDKYSELRGVKVNATAFEENLADFSGVNLAYTAYRKWRQKQSSLEKLPGIKYNPNQLFWIMTGTYLCQEPKLSDVDETKRKRRTYYAIPNYRVVGRLQNSPYFADDFDCPVGSPMNPKNKCRVFA